MITELEDCMNATGADWKVVMRLEEAKNYVVEEMRKDNAKAMGGAKALNRYNVATKFLANNEFNFAKVHCDMSEDGVYTQTLTNGFMGIVLKNGKKLDFDEKQLCLGSKVVEDVELCFENAYRNYHSSAYAKTVSIQSMKDAIIATGQRVAGKSLVKVFFTDENCCNESCFDARKVLTALEICGLTGEISVNICGTLMVFDDNETDPDCKFIIAGIDPKFAEKE
jgi:hypothetical protein